MTVSSMRLSSRRGSAAWLVLVGISLTVLVGLLGMHVLSSAHPTASLGVVAQESDNEHLARSSGAHQDEQCAHPPTEGQHGPCPDAQHPGPVCKSGSVSTGTSMGHVSSVATTVPTGTIHVSPATIPEPAGTGNGRGPPSLLELSISRT